MQGNIKTSYSKLFSPIKIGTLELPNRAVQSPLVTNFFTEDGEVTEKEIRFLERRAKGVGLIVLEAATIEPASKLWARQLMIDDDRFIPGLKKLTDRVHEAGGLIGIQLEHSGNQASSSFTGKQPVAPSPIKTPGGEICHELTVEEIHEIVGFYADAAERARKAGFDLVEIHGAHSYLPEQFLNPAFNFREDEYGGTPEKREKFPLEVVDAVRERVGKDFPLSYRIYSEDNREDNVTVHYIAEFAKKLANHGIDLINVSGSRSNIGQAYEILGVYTKNAEIIRRALNGRVPVAVANRIKTPAFAEYVLESGKADVIYTARNMICDPDYFIKAREGREDEIRYCLGCNRCICEMIKGNDITCQHNPTVGREYDFDLKTPAAVSRKVVVVGAGVAGMEAAYVAASKGHQVVLFDKKETAGGTAVLAARPPHKEEVGYAVQYLKKMVELSSAVLRFGEEVGVKEIMAERPDVVILATGGQPIVPESFISEENRDYVCTAEDVLEARVRLGQRVVVIGGGSVGMETAEHIARQIRQVTVIEMRDEILADQYPMVRNEFKARALHLFSGIAAGEKVESIADHTVVTDKRSYKADSVVLAMGYCAYDPLSAGLKESGVDVRVIGDAVKARNIYWSINEALETAYTI